MFYDNIRIKQYMESTSALLQSLFYVYNNKIEYTCNYTSSCRSRHIAALHYMSVRKTLLYLQYVWFGSDPAITTIYYR